MSVCPTLFFLPFLDVYDHCSSVSDFDSLRKALDHFSRFPISFIEYFRDFAGHLSCLEMENWCVTLTYLWCVVYTCLAWKMNDKDECFEWVCPICEVIIFSILWRRNHTTTFERLVAQVPIDFTESVVEVKSYIVSRNGLFYSLVV